MEYYDNCPACGNPVMRVTESGGDGEEVIIVEDCQACGHRDTFRILVTNQEMACNA